MKNHTGNKTYFGRIDKIGNTKDIEIEINSEDLGEIGFDIYGNLYCFFSAKNKNDFIKKLNKKRLELLETDKWDKNFYKDSK